MIAGNPRWLNAELQSIADSDSPAEALLAAHDKHATDVATVVNGPFGLAIVDEDRQSAILAVDRFGIESMYWAVDDAGTLHFSTGAGHVVDSLPNRPDIDPQSVYDYLYFHCIPSPSTIWKGVFKLRPGECLVFERGRAECRSYWTPSFARPDSPGMPALTEEFFSSMREAVAWSAGDGTAGAFLSGGLDSSTVCGILQESSDTPVDAFSVGFSDEAYNELEYAKLAAQHFNLRHHCIEATTEETLYCLERVFAAYDEPFGNSSVVPTYICASAAAREGKSLLLAGDGGDELFGGNVRYAKQKLFQQYARVPQFLRKGLIEPMLLKGLANVDFGPVRKSRRYVEQALVPLPDRMESYNHLEQWKGSGIFRDGFLDAVDPGKPMQLLSARFSEARDADFLDRMLYLDWKFTLADNDLRKVTRMCSLAGVNVEFPFLDERVVEMSMKVPSQLKLRRLRLRHFYKEATARYLPEKIINKSKHGFGLPFGEWLKTSNALQDFIYSALSDLGKRDIVSPVFIDELIRKHRDEHAAYYGNAVWVFMALEMWFRSHAGPRPNSATSTSTTGGL